MSALDHYTLGATDAELRRLIALASHEEDHVIAACRRAGVVEGMVVGILDAGHSARSARSRESWGAAGP